MKYSLNGIIYRNIIDPILSQYYPRISEDLKPGDTVLDVACGTGSLSLAMAALASRVKGIDLSEEMIGIANDQAERKKVDNLEFEIRDASDLSSIGDNQFNVAVTSMAIHQFDAELALQILKEMKRIAPKVIIMDYNYPMEPGMSKLVIFTIERIAGGDHYRNFRRFNELGGLDYFTEQAGLRIECEKLRKNSAFRVV
ncbi:MAG: class I SAM-dependent methyltransferase, partial [Bacteroidales bacterium]|nr:class I SAM-dependent methyltransferase [Bacteroidales bacterium]